MKKETWKTIERSLAIAMGVSVGAYIARVALVIINHTFHPELFAFYSAPWYTPMITASVFWGIVLLIEAIVFLIAHRKAGEGPVIGVIERKDK